MVSQSELQQFCMEVEAALAANPHCNAGLFGSLRAYTSPGWLNAQSEEVVHPELLAMICTPENGPGFWYGYIGPARNSLDKYVALIVRLTRFLNADHVGNLFGFFNSQTTGLNAYHPCKIQNDTDAYDEADSFSVAVESLISMIKSFDLSLRDPDIQSSHYMDQYELRIFDYLGFRRWL